MTAEEQAEAKRLSDLEQIGKELDEARRFDNTEEIARCIQDYADLNNGITIETKAEVASQRDEALAVAETYLTNLMESEGIW